MRLTMLKLSFLAMLALLPAFGCGGPGTPAAPAAKTEPTKTPEEVLVGNWQGGVELDQEVIAQKLDAVKGDEEATNLVRWSIETPASLKSSLSLKPDGSMSFAATINTADGDKTTEAEGTWEVLSAEGDQAKVRLKYEGQVEEKVFTFEDADSFGTDPPGDKSIGVLKFKRLR